jgi:NAD(P)-dependent dehydrogenase (short-subunit alcohol dehydrogenase family)
MSFVGQSAVISGGAGGLGGASARRLIEMGYAVVILEPDGARGAEFAASLGANATAVEGGHDNDEAVHAAIHAAQNMGRFSVNVNSVGVSINQPAMATMDGTAHDMQTFRDMMELHLFGPFNMARLCASAFTANQADDDGQRGVIINTASTAAYDGQARQIAYSAAKSGIVGMTLAMARDMAEIGVRANAIAPGPMWTPRLASAPQSMLDELCSNVAFPKRFGKGEEFASLVEAIIRTPFLNGQTIRLDGAMSTPLTNMNPGAK